MLDLALTAYFLVLLALGLRRRFIWVLAYIYIDVFEPQQIATEHLGLIEPSLIAFVFAVGGWLRRDAALPKRWDWRQSLILMLLAYCAVTTQFAVFPVQAADKWAWVWKALLFAAFLPLALTTRLRLEATALTMVLALGAIVIDGSIKTLTGGGGYGELKLFVNNNASLYESSILSCVAIAVIPLVLWLARFGTIFPPDGRVRGFAAALIFACLLIPVGTAARTGLVCAALLGVLMLLMVRRRVFYLSLVGVGLAIAVPLLPQSFTQRMSTIGHASADQSAATRMAVWAWTIDYAHQHPFGGGFEIYRGNRLKFRLTDTDAQSGNKIDLGEAQDKARAFHSAYFEMLGEQGWPGLVLWLVLQLSGLLQLGKVRRRLRDRDTPADRADAALATALVQAHLVYLFGAGFVGIAYQPFVYMLIAMQIALAQQVKARTAPKPAPVARPLAPPGVAISPL